MITHRIPFKSRIIPTENNFTAPFTGIYDFGAVAGNARQVVFNLDPNSVYFLDNFSVGGNITSEDFLASIATVPILTLSKQSDRKGSTIYARSFPISQFFQSKECTCFVDSNRGNDALLISLSGVLNQTANLVGLDPLKLTISFSVFAMDEKEYNSSYRDRLFSQA